MRIVTATLLSLLLSGCVVSTKPPGDTGFARAGNLQAFDGCFANIGEAAEEDESTPLSQIFWWDMDESVEVVKIDAEWSDSLHVSAINSGRVIWDDWFLDGKDFKFAEGRIKLKSMFVVDNGLRQDSVGIGVASGTNTLGLDKAGNLRTIESVNMAFAMYLVLPIVGHVTTATRFKRLDTCPATSGARGWRRT